MVAFIGFSIWVSLRLISENRYYPATGWIIISIVFIFFLVLSLIKPGRRVVPVVTYRDKGPDKSITHKDGEFAMVCSSKDIVRIAQIEQALRIRGINCTVLDRHGSVMMSFIPDVEMRIVVPRQDYEWSVQIVKELTE